MNFRISCQLEFALQQPAPFIALLNVHSSRVADIVVPDHIRTTPELCQTGYWDYYGNWCNRFLAPAGRLSIVTDGIIRQPEAGTSARSTGKLLSVQDMPNDVLLFLLPSRYCETDQLNETAWDLFQDYSPGIDCVRAICDFVSRHLKYCEDQGDLSVTACSVLKDRMGKSRDYAHLAISFCRCMNIPARYCSGYLQGEAGRPDESGSEFSAWFEAYIGNQWLVFDPRFADLSRNRVLVARGRDAADVAMTYAFGAVTLLKSVIRIEETDVSQLAMEQLPG